MQQQSDEFEPIKSFPSYQISRGGQIKNPYGKILKLQPRTLYLGCTLYKDQKPYDVHLHRLLALQFIENPENKPQVDHIDRNKLNNDLSNLRWVTAKENNANRDVQWRSQEYWRNYKTEKAREYRAAMTEEAKEEHLEERKANYAVKGQTETQREAAKERAKRQRERINADPEKQAQQREYKRIKAQEYYRKKKAKVVGSEM
jgi:hypothetical protein